MGKFALRDAIRRPLEGDLDQPPPLPSAIPPRHTSNLDRRTREYLTPAEVEKLLQASYWCLKSLVLWATVRPN